MTTPLQAPPLLEVQDLTVRFRTDAGWMTAVDRVSLSVGEGDRKSVV